MDAASPCLCIGDDVDEFFKGSAEDVGRGGDIDEKKDGDSEERKGLQELETDVATVGATNFGKSYRVTFLVDKDLFD